MSYSHPSPLPSISTIHKALTDFQLSPSTFRILYTISSSSPSSSSSPQPLHSLIPSPKTLYILDSSFNPPTLAHQDMASSALHSHHRHQHTSSPRSSPCRLLLLLATQNADKQLGPARFEHRLAMMGLLAGKIARMVGAAEGRKMKGETSSRRWPRPIGFDDDARNDDNELESGATMESEENGTNHKDNDDDADAVTVDIGVTKKPYFHDKAAAIAASGLYYDPPSPDGGSGENTNYHEKMEQEYLVGFDTLIRLLDPKYYPPSHNSLLALDPFFITSRLQVTRRAGGDYGWGKGGDRDPQDEYVRALAAGEREGEGGRREWAQRVQLVGRRVGEEETEDMISSTKVREAVKRGDEEMMKRLVPEEVGRFVLNQGIYRQDEG